MFYYLHQLVTDVFSLLHLDIKFNQSAYNIYEDSGSVNPVLILSDLFLTDYTVRVNSISESASGKLTVQWINVNCGNTRCILGGGVDYISGPYAVKIPAGVNNVSFSVLITNDNKREVNETFRLVIDSSSLPDRVVVGTPSQAVITIVDVTKRKLMYFYM